jgi:two-component system, OmpR family, sensor histidine kinase SenX3
VNSKGSPGLKEVKRRIQARALATLQDVDPLTVTLAAALGAVLGGLLTVYVLRRRGLLDDDRDMSDPRDPRGTAYPPIQASIGPGIGEVFAVLRLGAIVLDSTEAVVIASPAATALGLVRGRSLVHAQLRTLVRDVLRDGTFREASLELPRGPMGQGVLSVTARVAPFGEAHVLLLVEDQTQANRVEEVRRDFVANVSHELKTPVGGIALLAEAVQDASDDPAAVSRFARRIKIESNRLSNLVQEIVDLSRLQASESLSDPVPVDVAAVALEAVERVHTIASARGISIDVGIVPNVIVYGDAPMLGTAVNNLLMNAINYSPDGTRIAVATRQVGEIVEITVSDQGQGIPKAELQRIFERFYRVDAARSRATGGTGLGLAIVKHICTNHGGEVVVWSEEGEGSTFTIRLPAAPPLPSATPLPGTPPLSGLSGLSGPSGLNPSPDHTNPPAASDVGSTTSTRPAPSRRGEVQNP